MSDSDLDDVDLNNFDFGSKNVEGRFKKNTDNQSKRSSTASTSMVSISTQL